LANLELIGSLVNSMSVAEKATLLQVLAHDLAGHPGIARVEGVAGGEPCIIRTRIPVWVLVQARRLGVSESELLQGYPALTVQDLVNAWAYSHEHRGEIDQAIMENETA
jgi:uncharacterized protein (DUF433 family)